MRSSVRIATIGGIEIGVHYSWVLVFLLVAWTLAVGLFPQQNPGLGGGTYWVMGFASSFLLFVSVLVHEMAHSFVANMRGLRVSGITLFVFGGVSNISGEPSSARDELAISIVGPLTSFALGAIFWVIWIGVGAGSGPVQGVLLYLSGINVLLAIFNLIPGFPLDGGRVFRAVVWGATGSLDTATKVAVAAGHVVAFVFILGGMFLAFTGAIFSGIWLVLIGWFLNNAAEASGQQTQAMETFRGVTVGQVMEASPQIVTPEESISEIVQDYILQRGIRSLPVVAGGMLVGMVTLNEIRAVPRDRWDATSAADIMATVADLHVVRPEDELMTALSILAQYDVNQLPVVEDGRLVGLLSRSHVIGFLQVRAELGISGRDQDNRRAA